jgi:hypothetical protein
MDSGDGLIFVWHGKLKQDMGERVCPRYRRKTFSCAAPRTTATTFSAGANARPAAGSHRATFITRRRPVCSMVSIRWWHCDRLAATQSNVF